VKVEAQPTLTRVRVCDAADGADCAQPRYEGDVSFGSPVALCPSSSAVTYRELDPATGAYASAVTARCDAATDIEL
jgi:hypothetical protein